MCNCCYCCPISLSVMIMALWKVLFLPNRNAPRFQTVVVVHVRWNDGCVQWMGRELTENGRWLFFDDECAWYLPGGTKTYRELFVTSCPLTQALSVGFIDSETVFLWNVVVGLKIALCSVPKDQNVNLYVYRNIKLSKPGVHKWRPVGHTGDWIFFTVSTGFCTMAPEFFTVATEFCTMAT